MRYWIGGSPCAGKSSVARLLSERHRLPHVECDALTGPRPAGLSRCARLARPPSWQAAAEIAYYRAQFAGLVSRLPPDGIVEGADLLPAEVLALGVPPGRAVWIVPSPAFQLEHYRARPWALEYVAACPDPALAFAGWMSRDLLFAAHVHTEAARLGGRVIVVDGTRPVERIAALVTDHFGL